MIDCDILKISCKMSFLLKVHYITSLDGHSIGQLNFLLNILVKVVDV